MNKFKADPFPMDTPNNYPTPEMKELFKAILKLETPDEAANFFRDLLTMAEIKEFANRWQMVKLLAEGNSYVKVAEKLGVSTATITRVAYWLHNGQGGYKLIAGRMYPKPFKDTPKSRPFKLRGKYTFLKKV